MAALSHHGHEDSSACRPTSIKCGRTIWLTHRAEAVWSAPARWVDLPQWRADNQTHPPCGSHPPLTSGGWLPHGGQGSISLEYQTYNSAHLYDTLVTGMAARGSICLASTLFRGPITEKYIQASLTYQERGPFFLVSKFQPVVPLCERSQRTIFSILEP